MITLKSTVLSALSGVCEDVIYGWPKDFAGRERLIWRESLNREFAQTDAAEYLAEMNYTLDIFAPSAEGASSLFADADACMLGAGFRREAAQEVFEQDSCISHISARYRALADAAGNIYQ